MKFWESDMGNPEWNGTVVGEKGFVSQTNFGGILFTF